MELVVVMCIYTKIIDEVSPSWWVEYNSDEDTICLEHRDYGLFCLDGSEWYLIQRAVEDMKYEARDE